MGKASVRVDESFVVAGSSTLAVIERVKIVLRDVDEYTVAVLPGDVVQLARSSRKLFSRATQSCTVRVAAEPQGLVVVIHGEIEPSYLELLKGAISGRSREQMQVHPVETFEGPSAGQTAVPYSPPSEWFVAAPPGGADPGVSLELRQQSGAVPNLSISSQAPPLPRASDERANHDGDRTVIRARATPNPHPHQPQRSLMLYTSDGRSFGITGLTLVGRAPSTRAGDPPAAEVVVIDDPAMSKTHLWIGREADHVWVEDRNSGNGTILVGPSGEVELPALRRTVIEVPTTLLAGDSTLSVSWGAG